MRKTLGEFLRIRSAQIELSMNSTIAWKRLKSIATLDNPSRSFRHQPVIMLNASGFGPHVLLSNPRMALSWNLVRTFNHACSLKYPNKLIANLRNNILTNLLALMLGCGSIVKGQERLFFPDDVDTHKAVISASSWLTKHVRNGKLHRGGREYEVSVIAWKDPTLNPESPKQLAGYAITDTLWASYALTLTHPEVAKELHDSLDRLDCLGNSLHEVVWQRIESIHHKPIDPDIVHGKSIGIISSGDETVDIRTFTQSADRDFEVGHPLLFAEHAAYQSLYEYRLGYEESARNRLRKILQSKQSADDTSAEQHIRWDQDRGLLVDYVTESEYSKLSNGETSSCRQYSFKLAVLLYTCERLGLKREFPDELEFMHRQLSKSQLPSGGMAHFYDVDSSTKQIVLGTDATGEATAIFMLAKTIHAGN